MHPKLLFALACVCVLSAAGCFSKRPPASHFAALHLGAPNVPASNVESLADNPPDIPHENSSQLPQLAIGHNAPARPRVTSNPAPEPSRSEKAPEPIIAPEVPTQEMQAAKNDSEQSLNVAERNLSLTSGKNLNATQQDLVSKVHGFADSAREAMKAGDWIRAKNLSKKAEVLSAQLASSL